MGTEPISSRRLCVRIALVAGMAGSLLALLAVLGIGPFGGSGSPPPTLARSEVHVRVRVRIEDESGRPVRTAGVFALRPRDGGPVAERWAPEDGVLTLPAGDAASSFLVGAPGYRLERLQGDGESRTVRLRPGLRLRISLRNAPDASVAAQVRFLLRIRPGAANGAEEEPGLEAVGLVDLMDNLGGPGSGPRDLPRGKFGYAVSRVQAHAGILVPAPGRYHVHWGLMDTRAGTWFSLGDRCGRVIRVRDEEGLQAFTLDVTEGDLQQTLEGLRTSVKRIGED